MALCPRLLLRKQKSQIPRAASLMRRPCGSGGSVLSRVPGGQSTPPPPSSCTPALQSKAIGPSPRPLPRPLLSQRMASTPPPALPWPSKPKGFRPTQPAPPPLLLPLARQITLQDSSHFLRSAGRPPCVSSSAAQSRPRSCTVPARHVGSSVCLAGTASLPRSACSASTQYFPVSLCQSFLRKEHGSVTAPVITR